jgi:hypothetical protein
MVSPTHYSLPRGKGCLVSQVRYAGTPADPTSVLVRAQLAIALAPEDPTHYSLRSRPARVPRECNEVHSDGGSLPEGYRTRRPRVGARFRHHARVRSWLSVTQPPRMPFHAVCTRRPIQISAKNEKA